MLPNLHVNILGRVVDSFNRDVSGINDFLENHSDLLDDECLTKIKLTQKSLTEVLQFLTAKMLTP